MAELGVPVNPALYQIYDPLSVRADPARAGHSIRDSFPGNVVPQSRQNNPVAAAERQNEL